MGMVDEKTRSKEKEGDVKEASEGPQMESVQFGILENVASDRRRNRRVEEAVECEQGTIYDAYVNSWNNGDTACSCHAVAEEKERSRFTVAWRGEARDRRRVPPRAERYRKTETEKT